MESMTLFDLDRSLTKELLESARKADKQPSWHTVAFEGYPTAMLIRPCEADARPVSTWKTLPPFTLNIARIPTHHWHRFVTEDESGSGALAFTVHGDDGVPLDAVKDDLMTEV